MGALCGCEKARETPGLCPPCLVQCFMHRRPQSLLLPECVLWKQGRAGVGEKGILAGNLVGARTRREAG